MYFPDRTAAGQALAERLVPEAAPVVVSVPNGGIPVSIPVAESLGVDVHLCLVAKVPLPTHRLAGIGALSVGGNLLLNEDLIAVLNLQREDIDNGVSYANAELEQRAESFGGDLDLPDLSGRSCFLVDDGLASGFTALLALSLVREKGASRVVVASPVASIHAVTTLSGHADEVVALRVSHDEQFLVDAHYSDFADVSSAAGRRLVDQYRETMTTAARPALGGRQ